MLNTLIHSVCQFSIIFLTFAKFVDLFMFAFNVNKIAGHTLHPLRLLSLKRNGCKICDTDIPPIIKNTTWQFCLYTFTKFVCNFTQNNSQQ